MQDDAFTDGEPISTETLSARTITVVTLPDESRAAIQEGDLAKGLDPELFGHDEQSGMAEVRGFVDRLTGLQPDLLLVGLQHALDEEHGASVQFVEQKSGYELAGVGLEIKDDSVTEEKLTGPIRVMFVSWNS